MVLHASISLMAMSEAHGFRSDREKRHEVAVLLRASSTGKDRLMQGLRSAGPKIGRSKAEACRRLHLKSLKPFLPHEILYCGASCGNLKRMNSTII